MRPLLLMPCLLLAAQGAWAQAGDAPSSAACHRALQALQGGEEAAAQAQRAGESAHRAALARLQPLRERAARACLQARADATPPAPATPPAAPDTAPAPPRTALPPVSVPPLAYPAPGLPPAGPTPLPAPPPRVVPPASITSCDALGCWASDGTRLQRAAPGVLLGPRGFCSAPGGLLQCP